MRVHVVNHQRVGRVDRVRLRTLARVLMQAATRRGRPQDWSALTLVLLDHPGIVAANQRVFGRDYVTDVISQAFRPLPGPASGWSGELFLNVEQAAAEGAHRPGGVDGELAFYLAHGCDHLTGGRDDTPAQRAAMHRRERAWLSALARGGGGWTGLVTLRARNRP